MSTNQRLKTLLIKAGLSEAAVDFYLLLRDMPGASVSEIILKLPQSKSTLYRAYEELKNLGLLKISQERDWKPSG